LIASAIPVSASVIEALVITDEPLRDAGQDSLPGGVEVIDDLDTEPVLLQRHHSHRQRMLIRQRGEAVRGGSRSHGWFSLMQIAPGNPGPGS
jgi:hypothetical protein